MMVSTSNIVVVWLVIALGVLQVLCTPQSTSMKIVNLSGEPINVFWVDDNTNDLVNQFERPLRNGSESTISSYENHRFLVRFFVQRDNIETIFTKTADDETVLVTFDSDSNELHVRQASQYYEIEDKISSAVDHCIDLDGDEFTDCITDGIFDEMNRLHSEKALVKKYRDAISLKLRNYTCADPMMQTTEPVDQYDFTFQDKTYKVNIMLDLSHAKIWAVENFVSEEECKIFMEYGKPRLRRATVAAEDGTSIVSENRKAQQASYDLHQKDFDKDPLWPLQQRILALTNHHAGYNLTIDGQEGFTIIQYNPEDQYTPHCDGSCDNTPHNSAGRIATAVLYCKVPEIGGATTFTKADTFVKPKVGAATFFSYRGADGRMDDGFTEHSGCPVVEGEKWITTFWMRDGVTWENNHRLFDPSGLRILDEQS